MNLSNYVYMGLGATATTRDKCGFFSYYDDASGQCFDSGDEYAHWALTQADRCKDAGSPSPFFDVNTAHCVAKADGTPVKPAPAPPPPGDTSYLRQWGVILLAAGGAAYLTMTGKGMR